MKYIFSVNNYTLTLSAQQTGLIRFYPGDNSNRMLSQICLPVFQSDSTKW